MPCGQRKQRGRRKGCGGKWGTDSPDSSLDLDRKNSRRNCR